MAVTMADITKLRKMTGAGMMDCKNALTQANNDFDEAVKIIREKGKAVAAKRSDRCVPIHLVLYSASVIIWRWPFITISMSMVSSISTHLSLLQVIARELVKCSR